MAGLGRVCAQGRELGVERVGDVDVVVAVLGGHDPDLGNRPGVEAFVGQQFGEREPVACIRVDGAHRRLADGEMVRVAGRDTRPVSFWRGQYDTLRAHAADLAGDVFAQVEGYGHRAVRIAQEDQVVDADDLGGGALLGLAQCGHLLARRVVEAARIAVGRDAVRDLDAGRCPVGDRSGDAEVDVVGMRGHDERALNLVVS